MEGESPLLKEGALSLQTSLSHRELPPCPRRLRSENLFRILRAAGTWGKFWGLVGRCECFIWCGCRPRLAGVGRVGRVYDFRKCRLIPPHQSLARQLPPKGKPFLHCANMANVVNMADMANIILCCGLPLRSALIRRLRRHLPPPRGRLWCVTFSFWLTSFRVNLFF